MQLITPLPNRDEAIALHRQRWEDVVSDPRWRGYGERIETNALGQTIMTPPAAEPHRDRQGETVDQSLRLLGGRAKLECPVLTCERVKAVDVGWDCDDRHEAVRGQVACEIAPEICVEIYSRSNTRDEIKNKFRLFFEAAAIEGWQCDPPCWQCDPRGRMSYHTQNDAETKHPQSSIGPEFPIQIQDESRKESHEWLITTKNKGSQLETTALADGRSTHPTALAAGNTRSPHQTAPTHPTAQADGRSSEPTALAAGITRSPHRAAPTHPKLKR